MACIVYNAKHMLRVLVANPGLDFSKLPILHNMELLEELRPLVTSYQVEKVSACAHLLEMRAFTRNAHIAAMRLRIQ